jgi:N-acetylated-alpha-linked acidic dipeptidase
MRFVVILFAALCAHVVLGQVPTGFSEANGNQQREVEKKFDSHLQAANLGRWLKYLSSKPHHVGSPFGKEAAEFIRDQFRSWGYQAEIETYHVTFPTPRIRVLEMTSPNKFKAKLQGKRGSYQRTIAIHPMVMSPENSSM